MSAKIMDSKDEIEGKLLCNLFSKKAYAENSAVYLSELGVRVEDLRRLEKDKRIKRISNSPIKVFLTRMGKIIAMGECSLRFRVSVKQ